MLSETEANNLLNDLCVKLGFCIPPEEAQRIKNDPPADIQSFTDAVFSADGLDPSNAPRALYRQVRDMVAMAFKNTQ